MLRTVPVRQSPSPRTSPRRVRPSPQPQTRSDRAPGPQRFRFGPLLVTLFLCLAGIGVYMWPRVQVIRLAYRMQAAGQHWRELRQERDQLRLELASLKDPQRIYRVATEQLGMRTPRPDQVMIVTHEPQRR